MKLFEVQEGSMQPGLADGEKVLVDKITPVLRTFARGDIIVFKRPADPRRVLVKRVAGRAILSYWPPSKAGSLP